MNEFDSSMTALGHAEKTYPEEYVVFLNRNRIMSSEEGAIRFLATKEDTDVKVVNQKERLAAMALKEKIAIADNEYTSAYILHLLSMDDNSDVRFFIASNINANSVTLEALSRDSDADVRTQVAMHHNTPKDVLEYLAKDPDKDVRCAVADNPLSPLAALEILVHDEWEVRQALACCPYTPEFILKELANEQELPGRWHVRRTVARNPNAPLEVIEQSAKTKDYEIRLAASKNASIPRRLLLELSKDENLHVRASANKRLLLFNPATPDRSKKSITLPEQEGKKKGRGV